MEARLSEGTHAKGATFAPSPRDLRPSTAHSNRFLFTGREWMGEIGIYDYRNRVYSPELGRFLQTDPIRFDAGDMNLYRYVSNNPVNWVDPWGLKAEIRCTRCKGTSGPLDCDIYEDGKKTGSFKANEGPNSNPLPGTGRGGADDPYGTNGPIPPGTYDVVPRESSGGKYPPGTPSVTDPGRTPGTIVTPGGTTRRHIYIHGPGRSDGCITCRNHSQIRDIMNQHSDSGGMQITIEEICCD